jgi:hypothetical protein
MVMELNGTLINSYLFKRSIGHKAKDSTCVTVIEVESTLMNSYMFKAVKHGHGVTGAGANAPGLLVLPLPKTYTRLKACVHSLMGTVLQRD